MANMAKNLRPVIKGAPCAEDNAVTILFNTRLNIILNISKIEDGATQED